MSETREEKIKTAKIELGFRLLLIIATTKPNNDRQKQHTTQQIYTKLKK